MPELISHDPTGTAPDVEIKLGPCPKRLTEPHSSTIQAEVSENEVLINIPDVARYQVSHGRRILVDATTEAPARNLRLFLLGSAFGAIFFQRGLFPLHASVVVVNNGAVAFTGDSGAGKSTMAAWMNKQGYPLLCDDVCVVRFTGQDTPVAYPAFPRLKLWKDALRAFDIDTAKLQRDSFRNEKYHLSAAEKFRLEPVPLKHINVLQYSDTDSPPRIDDIKPVDAVHLLRNNTYRYQYISGLGLTRSHFLDCVKLARSAGVHYLNRPQDHSALAACQKLIEAQMQ